MKTFLMKPLAMPVWVVAVLTVGSMVCGIAIGASGATDEIVPTPVPVTVLAEMTAIPAPTATPRPIPTATPRPIPTTTPRPIPTATFVPTSNQLVPLTPVVSTIAPVPTYTPSPIPTRKPFVPTATPVGALVLNTPSPVTLDIPDVLIPYHQSLVQIVSERGGASGFIAHVTSGGKAYIVTNEHVVDGTGDNRLVVVGSKTYQPTVEGQSEDQDVAVLSICCGQFTKVEWSNDPVLEGLRVMVLGFPGGALDEITYSSGRVTGLNARVSGEAARYITHSAEVYSGSSGSPVFEADAGRVVGINRGTSTSDASKSYAISYESAKTLIAQWTGQIVSEVAAEDTGPVVWVYLSNKELASRNFIEAEVDTEFDLSDRYGLDLLLNGEQVCNNNTRLYAEDGRQKLSCGLEEIEASEVERASIQMDSGRDMKCVREEGEEVAFACSWRD